MMNALISKRLMYVDLNSKEVYFILVPVDGDWDPLRHAWSDDPLPHAPDATHHRLNHRTPRNNSRILLLSGILSPPVLNFPFITGLDIKKEKEKETQ